MAATADTDPVTRLVLGWLAAVRPAAYLATRRAHRSGPLFATSTGGRLVPADVWRVVRRLASLVRLPADLAGHLGPQAMRRSSATLYLDAGGSLHDLQDVLGHADPRTTSRYDRGPDLDDRACADQVPGDLVAAYLAGPAPGRGRLRRGH